MRIGIGYDVHKLVKGRKLVLGGYEIESEYGLLGHSDADVLAHAIMDAILGAINKGDIGQLFPDTDNKFKDIYSIDLLRRVVKIMRDNKYEIENIDTVLICEYPKIAPIRAKITDILSKAINIDEKYISIKASTSEGLSFTGRKEGIEARAVVLLKELE